MTLGEIFIGVLLGTIAIILTVSLLTVIITKYKKHMENKLNKIEFIYLGKLNDSSSGDDISEAVKYLKLTNSIK